MYSPFDSKDIKKIAVHFGERFLNHVTQTLPILSEKWQLNNLTLVDSFSASLLFKALSKTHGSVILKYALNSESFDLELKALHAFSPELVCNVYEFDEEALAILQEQANPGTTLYEEEDIHTRLSTFCDLYRSLYSTTHMMSPEFLNGMTTYTQWVHGITAYMESKVDWKPISSHMKKAKHLYDTLVKQYPLYTCIHGDFHYYNILKHGNGYKIIDPKGVMANPIFDLPRYMLNEFLDAKTHTEKDQTLQLVLSHFNKELGLSKSVLTTLLYIETAMAICWDVEDGLEIHKQDEMLKTLSHVASYTHY